MTVNGNTNRHIVENIQSNLKVINGLSSRRIETSNVILTNLRSGLNVNIFVFT